MLDRFLLAIEPFALTMVVLSGASLAGWMSFSNRDIVGIVTVFFGLLLIFKHIRNSIKNNNLK